MDKEFVIKLQMRILVKLFNRNFLNDLNIQSKSNGIKLKIDWTPRMRTKSILLQECGLSDAEIAIQMFGSVITYMESEMILRD